MDASMDGRRRKKQAWWNLAEWNRPGNSRFRNAGACPWILPQTALWHGLLWAGKDSARLPHHGQSNE